MKCNMNERRCFTGASNKGLKNKVINKLMKKDKLSYQEAEKRFNKMTMQEKSSFNKIAGGSRGRTLLTEFNATTTTTTRRR